MVRAWLISDAVARRWVEGWAEDVDLLAGEVPGQPACLFVARLEGRRELIRVVRLAAVKGWSLACLDPGGALSAWRWTVANGPARYGTAERVRDALKRHGSVWRGVAKIVFSSLAAPRGGRQEKKGV